MSAEDRKNITLTGSYDKRKQQRDALIKARRRKKARRARRIKRMVMAVIVIALAALFIRLIASHQRRS